MMTTVALAFARVDPLLELLEDELDDTHLMHFLDLGGEPLPRAVWESALLGPAREILARPGKEFRKTLVEIAWQLSGGASNTPVVLSLLVEILHAGSLVIDDIEDGSPYRRGKPALHVMVGVPAALNTGNWLYFWPFALLSRLGFPAREELELSREIVRTLMACHCGQGLDLSVKVPRLAQAEIPRVVRAATELKTGSLMSLAARLGARAAGADPVKVEAMATFGREIGVGLQMLDDLGGLMLQTSRHKGHEDLRLGRLTWPWAWLAERLDRVGFQKVRGLALSVEERAEHPETLAKEMRRLLGAAGEELAQSHLDRALRDLTNVMGTSPMLAELAAEIDRMRASYVG